MLAVAVLLSILFGWMMGGKLRRLERIQLFWLPLPLGDYCWNGPFSL